MSVAVMGCVVNGPGESKHANIGISLPGTGENPVAPVYEDGAKTVTLKGDRIAEEFQELVERYIERTYARNSVLNDLSAKKCVPCEGGVPPLTPAQAKLLRKQLHEDWQIAEDSKSLKRSLKFKDFYRTMSFVNALAHIANTEDHHPDLECGLQLLPRHLLDAFHRRAVRKRLHLRGQARPSSLGALRRIYGAAAAPSVSGEPDRP